MVHPDLNKRGLSSRVYEFFFKSYAPRFKELQPIANDFEETLKSLPRAGDFTFFRRPSADRNPNFEIEGCEKRTFTNAAQLRFLQWVSDKKYDDVIESRMSDIIEKRQFGFGSLTPIAKYESIDDRDKCETEKKKKDREAFLHEKQFQKEQRRQNLIVLRRQKYEQKMADKQMRLLCRENRRAEKVKQQLKSRSIRGENQNSSTFELPTLITPRVGGYKISFP